MTEAEHDTSRRIDAVIYDFGGVFMASPFEAIRQLSEERGHDLDVAQALLFGSYDEDTDHPWHRAERGELDVMTARTEIRSLADAQEIELDLFDLFHYIGADNTIYQPMVDSVRRARAKGCKTAILTNNIVEGRDYWKGMVPVDELFDVIVDSSEVGMRKPDPRIYLHVLELLGDIPPHRAVFLDDFPSNVHAAEALGIIGIIVEADRDKAIAQLDALLASD